MRFTLKAIPAAKEGYSTTAEKGSVAGGNAPEACKDENGVAKREALTSANLFAVSATIPIAAAVAAVS
jgi:hypothetical protein